MPGKALSLFLLAALAGCAVPTQTTGAGYELQLAPMMLPYAFAGQPLLLLANLTGDAADGPVRVDVRAPGAAVSWEPAQLTPPGIVEITIVPDVARVYENVTVSVVATRGEAYEEALLSFEVADPMTPPMERAGEVRAAFVDWLAQAHPELGIDQATVWTSSFARPNILVVSYYLFYSEDWEMGVRWHVMIPPYDWAEVYLRPRFVATEPTMQYKVDSFSAWSEPRAVPTEGLWR